MLASTSNRPTASMRAASAMVTCPSPLVGDEALAQLLAFPNGEEILRVLQYSALRPDGPGVSPLGVAEAGGADLLPPECFGFRGCSATVAQALRLGGADGLRHAGRPFFVIAARAGWTFPAFRPPPIPR